MNAQQKRQREKTLLLVSDAVERLRAKGVKETYRAIAEEADLSIATVLKDPIKYYLLQQYGIGGKAPNNQNLIDELNSKIQMLNDRLKAECAVAKKAKEECKKLKSERESWELKYRQLLLRYAIDIDKKITSIN